jgi:4'-phosphopantetheinyl transferase
VKPLSVTRLHQRASAPLAHRLENDQVDVWLLSTSMTEDERESHWSLLSPDEQNRASRFLFKADTDRFIAGRGGLRLILSGYSGIAASELAFEDGSHGKPGLLGPGLPLQFNVSHSGDCVLVGVTRDTPCGVDIENSRSRRPEIEIAERFFCPREIEWLKETEGGFLRLWAAKEAIIKAVGRGLAIPLSDVDVTDIVVGRKSSILLETAGLECRTIWVTPLVLVEGYASAVAVDGNLHSTQVIADSRK